MEASPKKLLDPEYQDEQLREAFSHLARSTIIPVLEEIKDVLTGKVESASIFHRATAAGLRVKLDRWETEERALLFLGDVSARVVQVTHEGFGFGLLSLRRPLYDVTSALVEEEAMKFLRRLFGEKQLHRTHPMSAAADLDIRLKAAVETKPGLAAEISNLELLDDRALWNASQTSMPPVDSERMEDLHRKQRLTGLSEAEAQELARLEQQYERVILVRTHSAFLLEQRGHDIRKLHAPVESRNLTSAG